MGNIAVMSVEPQGPVDLDELRRVIDGRWAEVRAVVRAQVPAEWCLPVGDLDRETQRARTLERARALAATDLPRRGFEKAYGGEDDIGGSMTLYEMLGMVDLSLTAVVLNVVMGSRTDVDVRLRRPPVVPLRGAAESVTEIRLYADEPRLLVAGAREHLAPAAQPKRSST